MPRQRRGIRGDVGIAPYAPPTEIPCVTFGRTESSAPTHVHRTCDLPCHSEGAPQRYLLRGAKRPWESVPPSPSPTQKGRQRRPFFIRNLK